MLRKLLFTTAATAMIVAAQGLAAQAPPTATNPCSASDGTTNNCSVAVSASVKVPYLLQLTLSNESLDLGIPTVADFVAGHVDATQATIANVAANSAWTLSVSASPFVVPTGAPAKLLTDLLVSTDGYSSTQDLSAQRTIGSGDPGAGDVAHTITTNYRTLYHWGTDKPGEYKTTLTFTLAAA